MGVDPAFRWRKSSFSGGDGQCVEVGVALRRSSFNSRVEAACAGAIRDSKHPAGPTLRADLSSLIAFAKRH